MTCDNIIAFPVSTPADRDPAVPLGPLRRPALLIRAARLGLPHWRRGRDLPKLLKSEMVPGPGKSLDLLRGLEQALNDARVQGAADYDLQRHLGLLIAILAEARLAAAPAAKPRLGLAV